MSIAAAAGGGSIAQAFGQLVSGMSQGEMYSYQGQVAALNAKIARQNAGYAAGATSAQVEQAGLRAAAQGSNVRAGLAANGLDVNSGSAANVQESTRVLGDLDTATIANKGAQQVRSYEIASLSDTTQEHLDEYSASTSEIGGALGASGSLLSSAPQLSDLYAWMGGANGSGNTAAGISSEAGDELGTMQTEDALAGGF